MEYKIIEIDLTNKKIRVSRIGDEILHAFLSGSGLAAYLMYRMDDYKYPPLSEKSILSVFPGLLAGMKIPTACKTSFCCRSPLSDCWNESIVGGYFGARMKQLEWDGLIIRGISQDWCYILITKDKIEIRNAKKLVGQDTYESDRLLKKELGPKIETACIGPAGEKLINISSVVVGGRSSRLAARGGVGAVFGSKKLKSIVVSGSGEIKIANPEKLKSSIAPIYKNLPKRLRDFGTGGSMEAKEKYGDLPIHNWLKSNMIEVSKITGQEISKRYKVKNYNCWFCPIACGKTIIDFNANEIHAPEYETLASFGSLCDISDLDTIITANDFCNRMGIDTISAGSIVAFAMEAEEKGLLKYLHDSEIKWGSSITLLTLLRKIVDQDEFGRILSKGTSKASEEIGSKSNELSITCKGIEVAMHEPRLFLSQALSYVTGARGGNHLESNSHPVELGAYIPELGLVGPYDFTSWESKENLTIRMQNLMSIYDATGICKFLLSSSKANKILEWINLSLNWEIDLTELMKIGERIFNLKRIYNQKIGFTGIEKEKLPERFLKTPRFIGGKEHIIKDFDSALKRYYELRNWDHDGFPTSNLIKKLGLDNLFEATKS